MILRKPYAFFIKYFRIIHLIMAIFIGLLIFQTNTFLQFFNQYVNSNMITIGENLRSYLNNFSFVYIIIVLIMDFVVWLLLDVKKKKNLFYVVNFIGYILVLVFYIYLASLLTTMSKTVVDIRLIMSIRDLVIITFTFQTFSMFIVVSRFLGFNIKKFNFDNDIKELNLTATDNEEFEVKLNFDVKNAQSKLRSTLRNFKYYFKENLRLIIPIITVCVVLVAYIVYKSINGNTTIYKQNTLFNVQNYSLKITDTLVTSKDYKANIIDDKNSLVILKVSVKTTNKTSVFEFGKFALQIGKNKYYHTIKYSSMIKDLGDTYIKQKLSDNYTEYLLVYEIPNNQASKKKQLVYVNAINSGLFSRDTVTKVDLVTKNLDDNQNEIQYTLNSTITLDESLLGVSSINFKNIELNDEFNVAYNKCLTSNNCYKFYEPLQATFTGGYDKALLKVDLDITGSKTSNSDVANIISSYGRIDYKINGVSKQLGLNKQVIPIKTKSKTYYFEVPATIMNAENIDFVFKLRGTSIIYKIK